jgi:short-subunit dehydrogenase
MKRIKLKPIEEQVMVITGSSSGIGLATAELAAECGARVVLSSRNGEALEQAVERIRQKGGKAMYVTADVGIYEDVVKIKDEALKAYGRIDTWVNNAGHSVYGPLLEIPLEEERRIFDTNFWGVRHGCRVAVPELMKNGGALINLGSEVSAVAIPIQGMYSATKHAVKAYTDALRCELENQRAPISVTLVRPSAINTPFALHAANHLDRGAPSLPTPIYDVENVAAAIVKCAETPKRDAYIGSVSRIYDLTSSIFPELTDRLLRGLIKKQSDGREAEHLVENESVTRIPAQEAQTRANYHKRVRKHSYYTRVTVGQKERPLKKAQ